MSRVTFIQPEGVDLDYDLVPVDAPANSELIFVELIDYDAIVTAVGSVGDPTQTDERKDPLELTTSVTDLTVTLSFAGKGDDASSVDWGDGTAPASVTGPQTNMTHTYAAAGPYTITVTPTDTTHPAATADVTTTAPAGP